MVNKEGEKLHTAFVTYQGYVDQYKNVRVVCGKELAAIEQQMDATGKSVLAAVKKSISEGKLTDAAAHAKDGLAELEKIQKLADASLAKPRVPGPANEAPHVDDRPDDSAFTALINKQKEIIGIRSDAEHQVAAAIKEAMPKAPEHK